MPALKNYHIMISHSWDYDKHYRIIKGWLDNAPNLNWTNYSVPFDRALLTSGVKELKQKIENRISICSCVIILSGMYVAYSDWIDFEIDTAVDYRKPIIGIRPWGQERVPTKVQNNADVMIYWNSTSVVNAVRNYSI